MASSGNDLLTRAVHGDRKALADLLEQHASAVRRQAASKIPSRHRSVLSEDDVMQQVYTDAFVCVHTFVPKDENSFQAWLSTLAQNNLLDAVRMLDAEKRGKGWHRLEPNDGDDSLGTLLQRLSGTGTTPSKYAAKDEARSYLGHAIDQLPAPHRQVVKMFDLEGRPMEEVAKALDRSIGAAYMLRARAHRQLAEVLGTASKYLSD